MHRFSIVWCASRVITYLNQRYHGLSKSVKPPLKQEEPDTCSNAVPPAQDDRLLECPEHKTAKEARQNNVTILLRIWLHPARPVPHDGLPLIWESTGE